MQIDMRDGVVVQAMVTLVFKLFSDTSIHNTDNVVISHETNFPLAKELSMVLQNCKKFFKDNVTLLSHLECLLSYLGQHFCLYGIYWQILGINMNVLEMIQATFLQLQNKCTTLYWT